MMELTTEPIEMIVKAFASEHGYPTPKGDIRALILRNGTEVLLLQEKVDGDRWTLPGGWADVGYMPFEVAAKEVSEETGLVLKPFRLLALFDKRQHGDPPQHRYVYKAFILCEFQGGTMPATRKRQRELIGSRNRTGLDLTCPQTG